MYTIVNMYKLQVKDSQYARAQLHHILTVWRLGTSQGLKLAPESYSVVQHCATWSSYLE